MATCSKCSTFYVTATNCPKDGTALLDDESARRQGIVPVAAERYALQSMLGEGGMGVVYLAIHRELGRKVAIKILRKEGQNAQSLERFKREAQASSLINHRNVVSILDFGELPDQSLFIVMEFLDGKSLADAIDNEGPFSVERTLGIVVQLAKGLAAAHEKKVIHRDLKPDNIFLLDHQDVPDFVKILDFGIAKMLDGNRLTKTGMVLGTPDYMSPEQATGQSADLRADVYAVGILMYEMLVGQRPFMGESFIQVLSQHLHAAPPLVANQRTDIDIPEGLDDIIQTCLAKQPDQRFQSTEQILHALYDLPGALLVLPEQLLPLNAKRHKSPPGLHLPSVAAKSNTAPPKLSPVPSLSGRGSSPSQSGVSRAVSVAPQRSTPNKSLKPQERDQQTMITEEPVTIPPPAPLMIEEDQPTSAWLEPLPTYTPNSEDSIETLPPELGKEMAKAAAGSYDTWHEMTPAKAERSTLADGEFDKRELQSILESDALTQIPKPPPTYGNRAKSEPADSKKVVVHSGRDNAGKVVTPAPANPVTQSRVGSVATLLDGQLNKQDILAQEDARSTSIGPNPMDSTSVVSNPLLVGKDLDDEGTSPPRQAPAIFDRKGGVRLAAVSVDLKVEDVLGEPTRAAARMPQPAPTAPEGTPAALVEQQQPRNLEETIPFGFVNMPTSLSPQPQKTPIDLEDSEEQEVTMRPEQLDPAKQAVLPPDDEDEDSLEQKSTLKPDLSAAAAAKQKEKIEQMARIALTARPATMEIAPQKSRKPLIFGALTLALVVLLSGAYWFILR